MKKYFFSAKTILNDGMKEFSTTCDRIIEVVEFDWRSIKDNIAKRLNSDPEIIKRWGREIKMEEINLVALNEV